MNRCRLMAWRGIMGREHLQRATGALLGASMCVRVCVCARPVLGDIFTTMTLNRRVLFLLYSTVK